MKKTRILHAFAMFCNLAVIVFTVMAVLQLAIRNGADQLSRIDCVFNMAAALCCIPMLVCNMMALHTGLNRIPKWVTVCKLAGTVSVLMPVLMVIISYNIGSVLGAVFNGPELYLFIVNPLLMLISFGFLEGSDSPVRIWESLLGAIPAAIYVLALVIAEGEAFFPLLANVFLPTVVAAAILCLAVRLLHSVAERIAKPSEE